MQKESKGRVWFLIPAIAFATATALFGTECAKGQVFLESFELPDVETFPGTNSNWLNYGINTPGKSGSDASRGLSFVGDSGLIWTIDEGNVDIVFEWEANTGDQSVDLNGWEPGSMFTTLSLAPGSYKLSFAFSKSKMLTTPADLEVYWDGSLLSGGPFTFVPDTLADDMKWGYISAAVSVPDIGQPTTIQTLRFTSITNGNHPGYGPAIDDVALSLLVFGDTDGDDDVDTADLITAFQNYTGAGGSGKDTSTGDTDFDGDVDTADLTVAFQNFTGAIEADLIYDPADGNVKLDASQSPGDIITQFAVTNAVGGQDFSTSAVNFPFAGVFQTNLATEISNIDGTGKGFSGIWDLGNIFPTNLDETSLASFLTSATYGGTPGTAMSRPFDLVVVGAEVSSVPEPGSLLLLGIGLCGLTVCGIRRGRRLPK